MKFPSLDAAIEILEGTDVHAVWDRFEIFEALHHSMQICNPMTSAELDEAVDACGLEAGSRVLDFACGFGEFLIRAADRASATGAQIHGTGIDLSPWMISGALRQATERSPDADLRWVLGEARDFTIDPGPDVAVCLGAEWIWHDYRGTVRALSQRLASGGVVCIGSPRLHHGADPAQAREQWGAIQTLDDKADVLREFGLEPVHRIDPDDDGWDAYIDRTRVAAGEWAKMHPGERADQWLVEQADWQDARERDRSIIGWSVWIARRA